MDKENLKPIIYQYLLSRPMFFSLIRPQEAFLFKQNQKKILPPILDLGCGDGFFAQAVFGKGKIKVGLDIKNKRTEKVVGQNIYQTVNFFNGVEIPFPNNYFQTVVSNCVLEHVEKLPDLLADVYRVLKPGGLFLTSVMTNLWEEFLLGRKFFGQKYALWMRKRQVHKNILSSSDWQMKFKEAKFKIINEIGYLSKTTSCWLDLFHYLSFPELISYKVFHRWVIIPKIFALSHLENFLVKLITLPAGTTDSAANFFVLQKEN